MAPLQTRTDSVLRIRLRKNLHGRCVLYRHRIVIAPEYKENRLHVLVITKEESSEIKRAYDFILDYVRNVHPGVSKVDVLCLAHAEQLGIPVVTDDEEMREAARDYGIKVLKTLELLKLMLDSGHIDMIKVREIVGYWEYQCDKPKNILKDYKKIFAEDPPK